MKVVFDVRASHFGRERGAFGRELVRLIGRFDRGPYGRSLLHLEYRNADLVGDLGHSVRGGTLGDVPRQDGGLSGCAGFHHHIGRHDDIPGTLMGITKSTTISIPDPAFALLGNAYLASGFGSMMAAVAVGFIFWSAFRKRRSCQKYGFEVAPMAFEISKIVFFSLIAIAFVVLLNSCKEIPFSIIFVILLAIGLLFWLQRPPLIVVSRKWLDNQEMDVPDCLDRDPRRNQCADFARSQSSFC